MKEVFEFAKFRLDVREHVLERTDSGERVALPDKAFDTLCILVRNHGRLVEKDRLLSSVWADSFVEENNLNKSIHAIRKALGENGDQKFIETVKKHGFRFVAEVKTATGDKETSNGLGQNGATIRSFPHLVSRPEPYAATSALAVAIVPEDVEPVKPVETDSPFPASVAKFPSQTVSAGRGRTRFRTVSFIAAAALIVVVAAALINRFVKPGISETSVPSLAVLPLKALDPAARDRSIELAVADSLILKLSESKAFNVRHLNAVRNFIDSDEDPVSLGRELGTDYVIASNYQVSGGQIRVTSRLINNASGETEQTFKSETDNQNVFAMQDAVANEIGNAVLVRFGKPEGTYASERGTQSEEAFNLYNESLYLVDKSTKDDSAKAAELLGKAVLLDPNYAQAWALRAQAYCQVAHFGGGPPDELFTIAEPMLQKSLLLDGDNAVALTIRGIINRDYHWNFPAAYKDVEQAIKIDPEYNMAHRILAGLYFCDRRYADAVEEQKKAVEINPTSVLERWLLGVYLTLGEQRDEGIKQLDRIVEMDPNFSPAYHSLWLAYHFEGDQQKAYQNFIKYKEITGTDQTALARYKDAYQKAGWPGVLRTELSIALAKDTKGKYSGAKYYIATLAALAGEKDVVFDYLDEAVRFHLLEISILKADPRFDSLRGDPRFEDILRRAGLAANS